MSIVERLMADHARLVSFLDSVAEISLRADADATFRKYLLLAIASFFEDRLSEAIVNFIKKEEGADSVVVELIRNKIISRQYHTFFNWEANNANMFFGMFGVAFREFMKTKVDADKGLDESIRSFIAIGRMRNELVHQNLAVFSIERTPVEIFAMYRSAEHFVSSFPQYLSEFSSKD